MGAVQRGEYVNALPQDVPVPLRGSYTPKTLPEVGGTNSTHEAICYGSVCQEVVQYLGLQGQAVLPAWYK